jgi:hypothetical protein
VGSVIKKIVKENMKKLPARDQSNSNMDFDGMARIPLKQGSAYRGNHWAGIQDPNKEINKGVGPRQGNQSSAPMAVGPSVTRDPHQMTIATAEGVSGKMREYPKNPDSQNFGRQERGAGGTEVRKPKNIDMINAQANPYNSSGKATGDRRSVKKPTDPDTINYGPKNQY